MKKLNYFTSIKFLSLYIKKHKVNFIVFYFGWFLDMIISIILPVLLGVFVDEIVYYQNMESFYNISLIIIFMVIFMCVLYFLIYAQHQYLMSMYTYDIKIDIFRRWLNGDPLEISNQSTGNVMTLMQAYSNQCLHFVIRNIVHFTNGILKLIIIAVLLFFINWRIGIFILVAAPISVYVNVISGKKSQAYGQKQQALYGSYIGWIYEVIESFRDLRLMGAQERVKKDFKRRNYENFNTEIKSDLVKMVSDNIVKFVNLCIRLVIFAFAGYLAMNNNMTIGTLLIIISYYSILSDQIWWTGSSYIDSQKRIGYIQSIYDFLNIPMESSDKDKQKLVVENGDIVFDNLSFSYKDSPPVINNLSLKIKAGERTAIVGESGCGKSTLAYLLLSFYKPSSGSITIDDKDISNYTVDSIRSNVGMVSQNILIFDATIRQNILLGNKKATEEEIINVCKKAQLWDFIETLPNKLDTVIGRHGHNLSGGQKQRIAIARIYIMNSPIIIFDEATSSIDDETEKSIHDAWETALRGRTSIVIAHKLSAVMLCDNIAVMKNGKIQEFGKTEKIIKNNAEFKKIFSIAEKKDD